ncbi:MAG TPA: hypothetical protein VFW40_07365 [Capsulimonadaceae bacterium]|nr:hypothetical protein [Capsulimonadaceae bacterium]
MKKGIVPIIIGIIVLIALVAGLNAWQTKSNNTNNSDYQDTSQQQSAQQQNTQNSSSGAPVDPADKPVAQLKGDLVDSLQPTQTVGDPNTAKTKVTIGYTFDTPTQSHPEKAVAIVDAVRDWVTKQGSGASLQLVCLDLPADQLTGPNSLYAKIPLGVSINGKQPAGFDVNPGEGTYTSDTVLKALTGQ